MRYELPHAEACNYWKTGHSQPDVWMERAGKLIEEIGGAVLGEAFGRDASSGRAAYMLQFAWGEDHFKVVWPVLPSRTGNERAARIQAATFLYHDVKAKCMAAKVLGVRPAFFNYLLLPDGRTAAQLAVPELFDCIPRLLTMKEE